MEHMLIGLAAGVVFLILALATTAAAKRRNARLEAEIDEERERLQESLRNLNYE